MLDNSRIVHRRYLMAYGTALISAFLILTINIELLTSQESTAQEEDCPEGTVPRDVSSVTGVGRIITVSITCETPTTEDTGEEETPDEEEEEEPTVPEEESNPSDLQSEDSQTIEESNPSDLQSEDSQTIEESTSGAIQSGVIHRNTTDGFQIQVPAGWVVEDVDNTNITTQMSEEQSGYTYLAKICPLDNALIVSGGKYQCEQGSTANVYIMRFNDLHQRPEFASLGNRNSSIITTSDFLSYYIQFWQIDDVQVWNNTDTTVNVINSQTNQTVATMPAKRVEYTYLYTPDNTTMTQGRDFTLLVLNGGIGYSLIYEGLASSLTSGIPPFQVDQVFDSFRLLTAPPGGREAI